MASITFEQLLDSRCYNGKPHFWTPQPLENRSYCVFTDETQPIKDEWGVQPVIQRILALGLQLELPVGEWVLEFDKKEKSKISSTLDKLLKTNIGDETFHQRGFEYAVKTYPISKSILEESERIGKAWIENSSHTLEKAALAEAGVFLISLSVLRLLGGNSLCRLAEQVSRDEARHVSTNRGALKLFNIDPTKPNRNIYNLVFETLDWLLNGLNVPGDEIGEINDFNKDFLMGASKDIVQTGVNTMLDDMLNISVHMLPFEVSNRDFYSRSVVETF